MQKYLKTFLEWLPRQTFFNQMEVVLDHNEPTSDEISWVKSFQKQHPGRLKHLIIDKVDPIGISMNRCIREAHGDFVTIWNVDDLRTPDSIQAQAELLIKNADISIAYGNNYVVTSFGSTVGKFFDYSPIPSTELTRSMILGPFYMFRKSLCEKAGYFDEQLIQGPDFDLAIRLALHGKAVPTRTTLGYYLDEGLGLSTRPGTLRPIERVLIELRYGIYDKINYSLVAKACRYNITNILYHQRWTPVRDLVPSYEQFLNTRYEEWHQQGIDRYAVQLKRERNIFWRAARWAKPFIKKGLAHAQTHLA